MKYSQSASCLTFMFSLVIFPVVSRAQTPIDNYILQKMKEYHMPGVGITYIKDGQVAMAKGYGYANIQQDIPFTPHSIIEIASISKTITATAAMQLWEQGLFDLDDPVNEYLPFPVINPFFPNDTITIRMLLNHTSSLGFGYSLGKGRRRFYHEKTNGHSPIICHLPKVIC